AETSDVTAAMPEKLDARRMGEALEELSVDVDRWLLLLPNPKAAEARELLNHIDRWTLLATCDHDGVVSCYRTLKGLSIYEKTAARRPQMSLALLDVRSNDEADRVALKLAGVCEQFLHWKLDSEPTVKPATNVQSHLELFCRAGRETVGMPQFDVVRQFVTSTPSPAATPPSAPAPAVLNAPPIVTAPVAAIAPTVVAAPIVVAEPKLAAVEVPPTSAPAAPTVTQSGTETSMPAAPSEVIDLNGEDSNPTAVVSAFVRGRNGLAETPVKAPNCPTASLAVNRDRKLVLVAVAKQGLCDLRDIAMAYRWLTENRPLIAMALPQFSIEPTHAPRLQLLVDQTDVRADVLQPLLKADHVNVQTYRKLRWGERTGLLLEAA
ncbi:MAG: hypothetical protein JO353_07875, partial [Phycisphaerae bacterium]|nr:hypothetical protein [Phycisphaerae bacterium]